MIFLKGIFCLLIALALFSVFSMKAPKGSEAMSGLAGAAVTTFLVEALCGCIGGDLLGIGFLAEIGKARIIENADALVEQSKKTGYNLGFGSAFPWGSNMMVADHGELLYMAAKVTGDDTYSKLAGMQLDYLLGNNALGYCFVTGYGTLIPEHPHHRPSQVAGQAVTGMLVGGPNKNLEDPYAKAVLAEQSAALCYVDSDQSYSTNEVTIYWNSPLIYLLAAEQ